MTLERYTPNRSYLSMQDTMNSLVNALFNSEAADDLDDGTVAPRMDMKADDNNITVKLTMPGIDVKDINISVTDGVLTIKGETNEEKEEKADEKSSYIVREHSHCSYYRSVELPSNVIAEKAEAEYKDGILTLTLPKAEEEKPKTIQIKTK